jgi:hypothetical protein
LIAAESLDCRRATPGIAGWARLLFVAAVVRSGIERVPQGLATMDACSQNFYFLLTAGPCRGRLELFFFDLLRLKIPSTFAYRLDYRIWHDTPPAATE